MKSIPAQAEEILREDAAAGVKLLLRSGAYYIEQRGLDARLLARKRYRSFGTAIGDFNRMTGRRKR